MKLDSLLPPFLAAALSLAAGCSGNVETSPTTSTTTTTTTTTTECAGVVQGSRCLRVVTEDLAASVHVVGADLLYPRLTSTDATPIARVPAAGGDPTVIIDARSAIRLASDADHLYWCLVPTSGQSDGGLMTAPLAGGAPTPLAAAFSTSCTVALDATTVFWSGDGAVRRMPKSGGTATSLVSGINPVDVTVFEGYAYFIDWENEATIGRVPVGGGAVETVASASSPAMAGLAVHATGVYWVNSLEGTLSRVAPAGGTPEVLATWPASDVMRAATVRVDDQAVYWATDGVLRKVPQSGGAFEELAKDDFDLGGFDMDATSLYWSRPTEKKILALGPR
jgi:hypothetical protein